jgi:hemerythrin-like domain-containing protein
MAEMSMNRVIHAAVRRDLDRFTNALSTADGVDERRAEQVSMAWANFHEQLTQHHSSEHRIAWPALRKAGISDDLLTQFDAEHDRMAAALESADQAMRSLQGTPSAENVKAAREAVITLRTTATQHLDHEEAELEPFYLEHAHTPEMKAMGRAFGREFTLPETGAYLAWLQDGASSDELAGLRQNVPGPVVAIIGRVFGGKYRRTIAPAWRGRRAS